MGEEKCNFILYDTDFNLLAVGKYNGQYIHKYNKTETNINPYRYESFIDFHSLLTTFYELSLLNNITIKSMVSCFNNNIRVCLEYNNYTLWTPSINDTQKFQKIMQINHIENKYIDIHNAEDVESIISDSASSLSSDLDKEVICNDEYSSSSDDHYCSDYSVGSQPQNIECSICYHYIQNIEDSHCIQHDNHNHNDICNSCLNKWVNSGNHSCPICGTADIHKNCIAI